MAVVLLSDPFIHWAWSIDIPPSEKIVIQPSPKVADVVDGDGSVRSVDVALEGFRLLGMGQLSPGDDPNSVQGITMIDTITCRLDSDDQLTVQISAIESDNMPIPHGEPALSQALAAKGEVLLLVTTDSLDADNAMEPDRMGRDVSNGGVLGAVIPVVDVRPS